MTPDLICPVAGKACRHASRSLLVKTACDVKTRHLVRLEEHGLLWCNDQNEYISKISFCLHHQPAARTGGSGIKIISGETKQSVIEVWL